MTNHHLVKPITCPRCKGTGLVSSRVVYGGAPGGCYKCAGHGVVEGDKATIAAAKARSERRIAAANILRNADLATFGPVETATQRLAAREYQGTVVYGFDTLETREPERFVKAVEAVLAGHPQVIACLHAYGTENRSNA